MSSSVDNLSPKQKFTGLKKPEVKAVMPPLIKPKNNNDSWKIDNSWKFMCKYYTNFRLIYAKFMLFA